MVKSLTLNCNKKDKKCEIRLENNFTLVRDKIKKDIKMQGIVNIHNIIANYKN